MITASPIAANIDSLIKDWTEKERAEILSALLKASVGYVRVTGNTWAMIFSGNAAAKGLSSFVTRVQLKMRRNKLVILEPSFERIEHENIIETICAKISKTWWKTTIIEPQRTIYKKIEHKSMIIIPRSFWRVRRAFIGADCVFPFDSNFSGDVFGPQTQIDFPDLLDCGLDVTLQIENTTAQEMPFCAVILGEKE